MFFLLLCVVLWAILAFLPRPDLFAWCVLIGFGWFMGFCDGKRAAASGKRSDAEPLPDFLNPTQPESAHM